MKATIVFALCICFAIGHKVIPAQLGKTALRNSRPVFVDCCLGRKLLCKNQPLPWARNRPTRPKLVEPSQVCDGIRDCPLGEDENCIKCENPPQVESGYRFDNQTVFTVGAVVKYTCIPGFVVREMDTIYCDYRGLWSPAPVCDRLCGDLPSVRNGSVSASGLLTPGTTVIVFCDDGFEPLRNFFTCATNGSWIGNPACVRRSCPVSALLGVANATRPEVTSSLTVGSVLTYICSGGFSPAPNSSMKITCNEMGEWTGNPACFINPPCTNVVTTTKGVLWRLCDGYAPGIGHPSKGRIEVNFDGTWGTVCDDGDFLDVDGNIESSPWSVESLNVACRTFGFSKSTGVNRRRTYFGEGVGPILLDDVICTGSETLLTDCSHSRDHIATGECSHSEDQGIECI